MPGFIAKFFSRGTIQRIFNELSEVSEMIIDIVCGVVLLAFALIGVFKGFARQIFKFLSFFAAIIGGFFLVKPVYDLLYGNLAFFRDWVNAFADLINKAAFIKNILGSYAESVGKTAGLLLSEYVFKLVVFILISIVVGLLFNLLKKIVFPIADMPVINVFDRVLGLIYAVAWAAIILVGLLLLTERVLAPNIAAVKTFFDDQMANGLVVGKYLMEYVNKIGDYLWELINFIIGKVAA